MYVITKPSHGFNWQPEGFQMEKSVKKSIGDWQLICKNRAVL